MKNEVMCLCMLLAVFMGCAVEGCFAADDSYVSIIPKPKQLKLAGKDIVLENANIGLADNSEQSQIAAAEINDMVARLGQKVFEVLDIQDKTKDQASSLIILATSKEKKLLEGWGVDVKEIPQYSQGYIVRSLEKGGRNVFILAGYDDAGMMYAAVTFRSLLKNSGGKISAVACDIKDFPDYRYRTFGSKAIRFENVKNPFAIIMDYAEWLFRHKINQISLHPSCGITAGQMKDLSGFIRKRRMLLQVRLPDSFGSYIWSVDKIEGDPRFDDMLRSKGDYITWSEDDLLMAKAERVGRYCAENGVNTILHHMVDGGGLKDPETWSLRSKKDRERFGDNRAEADAHVINMFYKVLKKHVPDMVFQLVVYPYGAHHFSWDEVKKNYQGLSKEEWQKNIADFKKELAPKLPKDAYIHYWLSTRELMQNVIDGFQRGQNIAIYYEYINPGYLGYVCPAVRYAGTNYFEDCDQLIYSAGSRDVVPVQFLLDSQFFWNTKTQGYEEYKHSAYNKNAKSGGYSNLYNDALPRSDIKELLGDICENIWGRENGRYFTEMFTHGLDPQVVFNEIALYARVNKCTRGSDLPKFELTEGIAKAQFDAAVTASENLEKMISAFAAAPQGNFQSCYYATYYKEAYHAKMVAGCKYFHLKILNLRKNGDIEGALKLCREGLDFIAKTSGELKDVDAKIKSWPSVKSKYSRTTQKTVKFYQKFFDDYAVKLKARADLVVKPRKAGEKIMVAIYSANKDSGRTLGDAEIKSVLDGCEDISAEITSDISLPNLMKYDCLVFSQSILGRSSSRDEYFKDIKTFVEEGGRGVIFYHDACGYNRGEFREETVFPEICVKGEYGKWMYNSYSVAGESPITSGYEKDEVFKHSYKDHITIVPGEKAVVIMKHPENGKPIVVAGEEGKGRVIYNGTILYSSKEKLPVTDFDKQHLINSIYWLVKEENRIKGN